MIVALLVAALLTVVTGLVVCGGAEQSGPLSSIVAPRLDANGA